MYGGILIFSGVPNKPINFLEITVNSSWESPSYRSSTVRREVKSKS